MYHFCSPDDDARHQLARPLAPLPCRPLTKRLRQRSGKLPARTRHLAHVDEGSRTQWVMWSAASIRLHEPAVQIALEACLNHAHVTLSRQPSAWRSCSRPVSSDLVAAAAVSEAAMLVVLGCVPSGSCRSRVGTGGSGLCRKAAVDVINSS